MLLALVFTSQHQGFKYGFVCLAVCVTEVMNTKATEMKRNSHSIVMLKMYLVWCGSGAYGSVLLIFVRVFNLKFGRAESKVDSMH